MCNITDYAGLDRVLYKGPDLDLAVYSRAELKTSDHRPGQLSSALFTTQVDAS